MKSISQDERRRRLGQRHFLAAPAEDAVAVSAGLAGLHSSDPVTVFLSCRARVNAFVVQDLEAALYDDRMLLRMLGMRRTLFVVPPDLAAAMNVACTRDYVGSQRRRLIRYLEDERVTVDGDAWLSDVEARTLAALREKGMATATELRKVVPELQTKLAFGQGKKWGGQVGVSTRVLFLLATTNHIVRARPRGSWISSQYRWAPLDQWIPDGLADYSVEQAQQHLTERWLWAFGPGTLQDLKWWTGWGVAKTRRALEAVGATAVALEGGTTGYMHPGDHRDGEARTDNWVALLPSLDPTVMGWKERSWYVSDEAARELFDRNGNAGATIWADGRVVGGWAQAPDGTIRTELLEPLDNPLLNAIASEAHQLEEWFGETRITPRFRTPLEKRLLG
ncbi:MAG: winged helix DNA-binding domain-containing protein [Acidimicrobiia bacterium]|nr:winged helix DNA-binding domain-containing protein [Acidimicrobiia bacterium]